MSKKGYKQESQAKIKSYIEPYSPHGEDDCILVLFFPPKGLFFFLFQGARTKLVGNLPVSVSTMKTKWLSVAVFIHCAEYRNSEWQRGRDGAG